MSSRRKPLLAALALAVLTFAYTWPLPLFAGSAVAHDRGDPLLVSWILWWTSHTVPLTSAWWNAPAFYPSTGVLAYSENLLSLAPFTAPVIWLTKSPIAAYNTAFFLSYLLCGLGAYLLGFVLTRSHAAAFVGAVAYAFAPYRLSHTPHLQLLSAYWMPVAIAALHLYVRTPAWRWAALFAAAWAFQALASGYYLFYLTAFAALWLLWFGRRLTFKDAVRLGAAWSGAICLLAPILIGYRSIQSAYGFHRSPVEVVRYSADVLGLFAASPDSWLWSWLHPASVSSESEQFPGLTVVLLLIFGLWREKGDSPLFRPRAALEKGDSPLFRPGKRGLSPFLFYAGAAAGVWMLSLGPVPQIGGAPIGVPGPYALLALLPGFDGMRVPARFFMLSTLCLAATASLAIARIQNPRGRRVAATLAVAALLLDAWPRAFTIVSAPGMRITTSAARVRLGLPLQAETETMFGAIAQARPVFNGYSGYAAPQHAALRDLLEHHDPRILGRLAAMEPIEVIVESAGDANGQWNDFVRRQAGARGVGAGDDWTAYELPATGAAAPAPIAGPAIPIAAIATSHNAPDINAVLDGDLDTRWHSQPQIGGETITVDLGTAQHAGAIVLCLGTYAGQYPRWLNVDVSADGSAWRSAWSGGTALETYDAAVRAPREVPITLPLGQDDVRFIRLRQAGREDRTGWTIVELRVIR